MRSCCLDRGCSRKLLARHKGELLAETLQCFFIGFFNSVVLSTSSLECMFAAMQQCVCKSKRPLSMAAPSAKHFMHRVKWDWRKIIAQQQPPDRRKKVKRSRRPLWTAPIRSNRNGSHMWLKVWKTHNLLQAIRSFKDWLPQEKERWSARATFINKQQRAVSTANVESQVQGFADADNVTGKGYLGLGDGVEPVSVPC